MGRTTHRLSLHDRANHAGSKAAVLTRRDVVGGHLFWMFFVVFADLPNVVLERERYRLRSVLCLFGGLLRFLRLGHLVRARLRGLGTEHNGISVCEEVDRRTES